MLAKGQQDLELPCQHHYIVATPHDGLRLLPARCSLCGEERQFVTAFSGEPDAGYRPINKGRKRGKPLFVPLNVRPSTGSG